jgi:hypothetical protein
LFAAFSKKPFTARDPRLRTGVARRGQLAATAAPDGSVTKDRDPQLTRQAEPFDATEPSACRKHGVRLAIDADDLVFGGSGTEPWPSLIMAITAHCDAVAALVAAGSHLRADFPADFYIYIKNTENLQTVSIAF